MTVPPAYLRQMKAKQAKAKQRREIEESGDPGLLRLFLVDERYRDPDDPSALLAAQIKEVMRQTAIRLGVCDDCLAKFPDPLAPTSR